MAPRRPTHTLRGERDTGNIETPSLFPNFNSHAPWGAWPPSLFFQVRHNHFNSHAPWGAWHVWFAKVSNPILISTHTLRGERNTVLSNVGNGNKQFQLTRSVGSVTSLKCPLSPAFHHISTHTLRGERDATVIFLFLQQRRISTHTLRGERDLTRQSNLL